MILQRIRVIVGDAGFELGTSALNVWCAINEPQYILYHILSFILLSPLLLASYLPSCTWNLLMASVLPARRQTNVDSLAVVWMTPPPRLPGVLQEDF